MRDGAAGRGATTLQCEVLCGGDVVYPLRPRDCVHVSMGGGLQGRDQAEQLDLLEHAQLYHDPDGWLRLRGEKRRARFPEIIAGAPEPLRLGERNTSSDSEQAQYRARVIAESAAVFKAIDTGRQRHLHEKRITDSGDRNRLD